MIHVRVLVVGELEVTRRGVAAMLADAADIAVVAQARSVGEALIRSRGTPPDVVVATSACTSRGAPACTRLRRLVPGVRLLVLSGRADPAAVQDAVRAGASGLVRTDVCAADLVAAVRAVAAGGTAFDSGTTLEGGPLSASSLPVRGGPAGLSVDLTPRELAILQLIGQGLTNREIGRRLQLAEKTVKNYTSQLLGKLDVANRTQAAVLVAGDGPTPVSRPRRAG